MSIQLFPSTPPLGSSCEPSLPPPPLLQSPPPSPSLLLPRRNTLPRRSTAIVINQKTLNTDIFGRVKLCRVVTSDHNAPTITRSFDIPGESGGLAKSCSLRVRSTSKVAIALGGVDGACCGAITPPSPVLRSTGLFAEGILKLRNRGGVDTGASCNSSYMSTDTIDITLLHPAQQFSFRKVPLTPQKQPASAFPSHAAPLSSTTPKAVPLSPYPLPAPSLVPLRPPIGKLSPTVTPRPKAEYPPRSTVSQTSRPNPPSPPPPRLPPSSINSAPNSKVNSALIAALKAADISANSPQLVPSVVPSARRTAPATPPTRGWNDPSSSSLPLPGKRNISGALKRIIVDDGRWKFKREDDFPGPRLFQNLEKVYKSGGKGSSVPLELEALR